MSIPQHTLAALDRYVIDGLPPGGFLTAVLSNNLSAAVSRADSDNYEALSDIVKYIYNNIPANAWGSPEAIESFLENHPSRN